MYVSHVCQGKTSSWNFVLGTIHIQYSAGTIRYLGEMDTQVVPIIVEYIFRNIQNKAIKL